MSNEQKPTWTRLQSEQSHLYDHALIDARNARRMADTLYRALKHIRTHVEMLPADGAVADLALHFAGKCDWLNRDDE